MRVLTAICFLFSMLASFAQVADSSNLEFKVISKKDTLVQFSRRVFTVVEKMPEFPGGENALMNFIQKNLEYPAVETDWEGRVVIGFVVNEDGTISDVVIKKSLYQTLDAEAIRVVKLIPKFIPGRQKGVPVKVSYILLIKFGVTTK